MPPPEQDSEDAGLLTEEDLKVKVVVPLLQDLGFALNDLHFEHPVRLSVGNFKRTLRYDILVSRNGKPLCLIEVKAQSHHITSDDHDQAVRYARLLRQMPPLAIVTSGTETACLDVLSWTVIKASAAAEIPSIAARPYLTLDRELQLRVEALRHFVSYSSENLRAFTLAQRTFRQQHLLGTSVDTTRKIIKRLFVKSQQLYGKWKSFQASDRQILCLLGDPGIGKTNSLWWLAEEAGQDCFSFFYDAGRFTRPLWEEFGSDFNWNFSSSLTHEAIVQNISDLTRGSSSQLIIFIDSIDESTNSSFPLELDDFIQRMTGIGARIVVGCRTFDWQRFLQFRDSPTVLEKADVVPISGYSGPEAEKAWNLYSEAYDLQGTPTMEVLRHCRDPFTLRVLSEVYRNSRVPSHIDVPDLLATFVDKRLRRTINPEELDVALINLARHIYDSKMDNIPEEIAFGINSFSKETQAGLLSGNIIMRNRDELGRNAVRFENGQVLSFYIAMKSLRWDKLSTEDFASEVETALSSSVGQSALSWFLRHFAKYESATEFTVLGRALAFVTKRNAALAKWLPGLRAALEPWVDSDSALELFTDLQGIPRGWSLIPKEKTPELVRIVHATGSSEEYIGEDSRRGIAERVMHGGIARLHAAGAATELVEEFFKVIETDRPIISSAILLEERIYGEAAPYFKELNLNGIKFHEGQYRGSFTRSELAAGINRWTDNWISHLPVGSKFNISDLVGDVPPTRELLRLLGMSSAAKFGLLLPPPDFSPPLQSSFLFESLYSRQRKREWAQAFFELAIKAIRESCAAISYDFGNRLFPWLSGSIGILWKLQHTALLRGESFIEYAIGTSVDGDFSAEASDLRSEMIDGQYVVLGADRAIHGSITTSNTVLGNLMQTHAPPGLGGRSMSGFTGRSMSMPLQEFFWTQVKLHTNREDLFQMFSKID